jgi:beta-glucosidase/6-phospho-beta-glucosidase/beta-galactosidase
MFSSWPVLGPEALHWAPKFVQSPWGAKEIFITENGCDFLWSMMDNFEWNAGIRESVQVGICGLQDAEAHTATERIIFPRGQLSKLTYVEP